MSCGANPAFLATDAGRQEAQRRLPLILIWPVNIAKGEQILEAIFPPMIEATSLGEATRVVISPEEPVPNWQIGEVLCVMAILVMHAMGFGPLYEKPQPTGRADVPVVKILGDCGEKGVVGRSANVATEQHINDCTAQ